MFTFVLLAINVATLFAGAASKPAPGKEHIDDFIPCC
jgi:hypothetical protein